MTSDRSKHSARPGGSGEDGSAPWVAVGVTAFSVAALAGALWLSFGRQEVPRDAVSPLVLDPGTEVHSGDVEAPLQELNAQIDFLRSQLEAERQGSAERNQAQERQLTALRREQRALISSRSVAGGEDEADLDETRDPDLVQQEEALLAEELYRAQMELLERTFQGQAIDPQWSIEVDDQFRSAFDQYPESHMLHAVECGGSMCRVEATISLGAESAETSPGLDQLLHGDAGWEGPSTFAWNTESGEVTIYLMREGAEMPDASRSF